MVGALLDIMKSIEVDHQEYEDVLIKSRIQPILNHFLTIDKNRELCGYVFYDNLFSLLFMCVGNRNAEKSQGSKQRRKRGRIPDASYKVKYNDYKQQIVIAEVKTKEYNNAVKHPDFIKIANMMKDEIDYMINTNCPHDLPVFGLLVSGRFVYILGMDLMYSGVYRLFDIGRCVLPTCIEDLCVLDNTFKVMYHLEVN
ncbi:uncharacterized protein B0P05DRAFT_228881 [Gilbertella persicaria]|uniref:uncharacterized protein n=1 Tax=Gilbertella persicaria TaxID=101096 RepID=UPI00221EEB6B|nr:uncharacterized protein B0P05DRAFT_228881 [Gilbertella persicaria]KAI8064788.1 hypothetical protein B0P05DRAFT_228881 [Gilbertella persicaria]